MGALLALVVPLIVVVVAILLIVLGILKLTRARREGNRPTGGIVMIVSGGVLIPVTLVLLGALLFMVGSTDHSAPTEGSPASIAPAPISAPATSEGQGR